MVHMRGGLVTPRRGGRPPSASGKRRISAAKTVAVECAAAAQAGAPRRLGVLAVRAAVDVVQPERHAWPSGSSSATICAKPSAAACPTKKAKLSRAASGAIGRCPLDRLELGRAERADEAHRDRGDRVAEQANVDVVRDALVDVQRGRVAVGGQQGAGTQFEQAVAVAADGADDRLLVLAAEDRLLDADRRAPVDFVLDLGAGGVGSLLPSRGEGGVALTLIGEGREAPRRAVLVRRGGSRRAVRDAVARELGEERRLPLG